MKRFFTSLPWRVFALTGLGVCVGVLTLLLSGVSYPAMDNDALLKSYVTGNFMVVPVNCLIPVLLIWMGEARKARMENSMIFSSSVSLENSSSFILLCISSPPVFSL